MCNSNSTPILIAVLGPTAVGKTAISILIAQLFGSEIVSSDSRQFYDGLVIGTAQPAIKELTEAKHHFIGFLRIDEDYSAGKFEKEALYKLDTIFKSNKVAVLTGGSGLYVNAVINGLDEMPKINPEIRDELNKLFEHNGIEFLQQKLKELDPAYYNVVDIQNPQRLIRGIEVVKQTGKSILSFRNKEKQKRPFKVVKVGLSMEREMLYERINKRVDLMLQEGLEEEARQFYPYKNYNALQTVGYQEFFSYFDGKIDKEEAIRLIKRNSRRYAKRQLTWLRKDDEITWFSPADFESIIAFLDNKVNELSE